MHGCRLGDPAVEAKIVAALTADFKTQVARGLRGVWIAWPKMGPVLQQLIRDL